MPRLPHCLRALRLWRCLGCPEAYSTFTRAMSVRSAVASTSRVLLQSGRRAASPGLAVAAPARPSLLLGPCTCTAGRPELRQQDSSTGSVRLLSYTTSVRAGQQRSAKAGPPRELRDEAIRPKWVKVVVQNEDGSRGLGPLEPKDAVLRRMERYDTFLLQGASDGFPGRFRRKVHSSTGLTRRLSMHPTVHTVHPNATQSTSRT